MFLAFKKTKILQLLFLFSLVFLVSFACDRQTIKTKLTPITIIGKGGSASLLHTWLFEHKKIYPHINIEYEVIGSTAGIKEFKQETVDFAISDRQITEAEIKEVNNGVVFLPITADAISVVYNLPEIKHNLRLSREVLANIFLGKITNWNDPQIQKINSSIKLPNKKIALVYRADGSMTNWIFTKYLSAISKEWQHKIGTTKNIQLSFGIGAKGRGFIDTLAKTENSIGFLNYSYAKNINMPMASLENQAGNYITPTKKNLKNTLQTIEVPENLQLNTIDSLDSNSYPIIYCSWILIYQEYDNTEKLKAIENFIKWVLSDGQKIAENYDYIYLPKKITEKAETALEQIKYTKY